MTTGTPSVHPAASTSSLGDKTPASVVAAVAGPTKPGRGREASRREVMVASAAAAALVRRYGATVLMPVESAGTAVSAAAAAAVRTATAVTAASAPAMAPLVAIGP